MINKILFPSQEKDEQIIFVIRKHWFHYFVFGVISVLISIPIITVIVYWFLYPDTINTLVGNIIILVLSAYLLSIMAMVLIGIVNYYLDIFIITDRRIVSLNQISLFRRKISEVNLRQIQDVSASVEGFIKTMLHYGDVYVQTAGERENFIFSTIPHPHTVSKKITELCQRPAKKTDTQNTLEDSEGGNL